MTNDRLHAAQLGVRRLFLALLRDAIEVYQNTASYKGARYEVERTWTFAWFFSPERYDDDDPASFENVCLALGIAADGVRRALRAGKRVRMRGVRV